MKLDRRAFITSSCALSLLPALVTGTTVNKLALKNRNSLPAIGMGTWLTFDIDIFNPAMKTRALVLDEFFKAGGGMIDSSPMYGRAEQVIGKLMSDRSKDSLFSATKIWSSFGNAGPVQLRTSHRFWNDDILDLVYVHNLLNWEVHLDLLKGAKSDGNVRYIGLTTSHGRRHAELESLLNKEDIDAVQITYNIADREVEKRLLPTSYDNDVAVIINRPFRGGSLFRHVKGHDIPEWANSELGIENWAVYFLKFIISHPAVNYAIPATRNPQHMIENMSALNGPMPNSKQRARMISSFEAL